MIQIALISVFALTAIVACVLYNVRKYPLPKGKSPLRLILLSAAVCGVIGLGGAGCGVNVIGGQLFYFPGLWLSSTFDVVNAWGSSCGAGGPEYPGRIIFWNSIAGVSAGACFGMLYTFISVRTTRTDKLPRCPCGYNLTGNVSGTCPECGKPIQ